MKNRICANCSKTTADTFLTVDGREDICWECATELALEAQLDDRDIDVRDENGEACHLCKWCSELFYESELREEVNLGYLCDRCVAAIKSRGETLTLKC